MMMVIIVMMLMIMIMMVGCSHIVGDSDALLDVDGDALLLIDVLANLIMMMLRMTIELITLSISSQRLAFEKKT